MINKKQLKEMRNLIAALGVCTAVSMTSANAKGEKRKITEPFSNEIIHILDFHRNKNSKDDHEKKVQLERGVNLDGSNVISHYENGKLTYEIINPEEYKKEQENKIKELVEEERLHTDLTTYGRITYEKELIKEDKEKDNYKHDKILIIRQNRK